MCIKSLFEMVRGPEFQNQLHTVGLKMTSPTVCVRFVVPRDARSLEVGTIKVSLKVLDFARSVEKLRAAQVVVKAAKAARTTKFIKDLKDEPKQNTSVERKPTGVICKAVTLTGAPCKSKASCGAYCKRHYFVSK